MNFPNSGRSRLACGILVAFVFASVQGQTQTVAAPPARTQSVESEPAKSLYADLSGLVKEYFPRAKVTVSGNVMHFEYKVHSQISTQTHLSELAPGIDGVLGDLEIKTGPYKGRESLPKRVNLITYEAIVLAPYSPKHESHIMARLCFDPGTAPEFLEKFKDYVNKAAAAADSPVKTAEAPPKTVSVQPRVETPAAVAANTATTTTITTASVAVASVAVAPPATNGTSTATTKTEITEEKSKQETSSTNTESHPSDALHDHDKTRDPWARNQLVILYYKKRATEQTALIKAKPNDPVAYSERSDCYLHLNNPKQAFEDADKAIPLCGKAHRIMRYAYCNRGEARIQLKQYKEALVDLERAISLEPDNGESIYFRGMVKEKTGDLNGAIQDYELARGLGFAPYGISVDYQPYLTELRKRIKRAWFPPRGHETKLVLTHFRIARNGSVKDLKVAKSSGVPAADAAALAAIKNAAPFERLPYGAKECVGVEFEFDYNGWGGGAQISSGSSGSQAVSSFVTLEDAAKQKLNAAEKAKDEAGQVAALISLGDFNRVQGDYDGAQKNYQRALILVKEKPDRKFEHSKLMGRCAIIHSAHGKTQEADTNFKEAFKLAKEAGKNQLDPDVTEMLTEYAKFLYKSSRFAEANKIYMMLKQ
ncbi:MAG: TonB family protein [Candidatus Melainabacteria bacterium]|nr:TonB family protein [Candidatus Melainabacteria bacterium]